MKMDVIQSDTLRGLVEAVNANKIDKSNIITVMRDEYVYSVIYYR